MRTEQAATALARQQKKKNGPETNAGKQRLRTAAPTSTNSTGRKLVFKNQPISAPAVGHSVGGAR